MVNILKRLITPKLVDNIPTILRASMSSKCLAMMAPTGAENTPAITIIIDN